MQDIHGLGDGGWLPGGGERRLRLHNHQALKCPRCDSLNTKFCYYNNYNLSQPRHFCKGCRRYWTRGGVLRNVPVGGVCRKTKRPKHKSNSCYAPRQRNPHDRTSSGESSSVAAAAAAATASMEIPTTAAVESLVSMSIPDAEVYDLPDSRFLCSNPNNPCLNQQTHTEGQICTTGVGSLTNHQAPSAGDMIGFNTAEIGTAAYWHGNQTPVEEISEMKIQTSVDWRFDQGLFYPTAASDPESYWNQNQWADVNDQSLNHNYIP